jgi:hypothetical protein
MTTNAIPASTTAGVTNPTGERINALRLSGARKIEITPREREPFGDWQAAE